jgi:Protein of unknown function (DUF2510)
LGGEQPTPAGWYPDPAKRFGERYWDGQQWTDQVFDSHFAGVDALDGKRSELQGAFGPVIDDDASEEHGRWALGFFVSFANTIAGGTSEIQRNIIAQRVLGLPRG